MTTYFLSNTSLIRLWGKVHVFKNFTVIAFLPARILLPSGHTTSPLLLCL